VIWIAYITAIRAREVDVLQARQAVDLALGELSQLLGVTYNRLSACLVASQRVSWAQDEFASGGYATVAVGKHTSRDLVAQPVQNIVFFAGEHTACVEVGSNVQTVHGAYDSGLRAAKQCISSLQPQSSTSCPVGPAIRLQSRQAETLYRSAL